MDPTTNPDVQEALSRKYSDDVIIILPLRSGLFAVFNAMRELCGLTNDLREVSKVWSAPEKVGPAIDLAELGLL